MFAKMAAAMGADDLASKIAPQGGFAHAAGMYMGGGALGAAAGGSMNLMFGDQEDFAGSVVRGGAVGLAGGAAMRSVTSKGGYLNDFGLAIGRTMDESSAVARSEKITKLQDKISKHEGKLAGYGDEVDDAVRAKTQKKLGNAQEQLTKLESQEGGGITSFFRNLSETAEERQKRVTGEYDTLYSKSSRTDAEDMRMAKMERDHGISRKTESVDELQVDVTHNGKFDDEGHYIAGTGEKRSMNYDEFQSYVQREESLNSFLENDQYSNMVHHPTYSFDDSFHTYARETITQKPAAGYNMHLSSAQNTISSRNSAMLFGGAGLTGAMVGGSHSSNRKSKRRGFNKSRGSRF